MTRLPGRLEQRVALPYHALIVGEHSGQPRGELHEQLILRVYRKYGPEHVGLVCTFPTYRLRSAVRELGKSLDLPLGELEKLAKLSEHYSARGLREELPVLSNRRRKDNQFGVGGFAQRRGHAVNGVTAARMRQD